MTRSRSTVLAEAIEAAANGTTGSRAARARSKPAHLASADTVTGSQLDDQNNYAEDESDDSNSKAKATSRASKKRRTSALVDSDDDSSAKERIKMAEKRK